MASKVAQPKKDVVDRPDRGFRIDGTSSASTPAASASVAPLAAAMRLQALEMGRKKETAKDGPPVRNGTS